MNNSNKANRVLISGTRLSISNLALAVSLAIFSTSSLAGKITSVPSASGADGYGGFNLHNIEVVLNPADGINDGGFDKSTGAYTLPSDTDNTYYSEAYDYTSTDTLMGHVLSKDWPIGEPPGIKIVNDDFDTKNDKPTNCIMSTSYLHDHFINSKDPQQVICSGPFQSHKRYKVAMLPSTIDGIGTDSVDLVFNVEEEAGSRDYQVFQKINNWTDSRLEGFTVQLGFGTGASFQTIAEAGVSLADLSLFVPGDIFDIDQMANFSTGLFGPVDTKHGRPAGFFDPTTRAGFVYNEYPNLSGQTDKLTTKGTLGSDYADVPAGALAGGNQFGPWLSNSTLPHGVFFDDDGNPSTDAVLVAWYGYNPDPAVNALGWMRGSADSFAEIIDADVLAMGENLSYSTGLIDDLVNVGLNYIVTVGDVSTFPPGSNSTFTIRMTAKKDTSNGGNPVDDPAFTGVTPTPKVVFPSDDAVVLLEPNPKFKIGELLTARVGDADRNTDPLVIDEIEVTISTSTGLPPQTLTLVELGEDRGVFAETLPESYSNVDTGVAVTMSYVDTVNADGIPVKTSTTTAATLSGKLQFNKGSHRVSESEAAVVIAVDRVDATAGVTTVEYSTVSGTAIGNEDYVPDTGTLTFEDGVDTQIITIQLLDDSVVEGDQAFTVLLSNVAGDASLGDISSTEVVIADNDTSSSYDASSGSSGLLGISWITAGLFLLGLIARVTRRIA